jgi:tryptophan synthase alpha subunit
MSRLSDAFKRAKAEGRPALIPFITAGHPTAAETPGLIQALVRGGADIVELGVPFSDPLADGATIQRASQIALEQGVSLADCLQIVADSREAGVEVPIVLMGYYNPIIAYGIQQFAESAARAGVDAVIAVDVPPEESEELLTALSAKGIDLVHLLAPTSTAERIDRVVKGASGFIYCVSITGVTGGRDTLPAELPDFLARVRNKTDVPLVVGFGISRREHVEAVGKIADGVAIGSTIVDLIDKAPPGQREEQVQTYVEVVTGRRAATV